MVQEDLRDQTN